MTSPDPNPADHGDTFHSGQGDSDKQLSHTSSSSKRTKTHVGPWRLGRTLGRGSSGRVRLAKHNTTGQLAAVKIVPKELVNHNNNNYGIEREVIIMKLIEHPNVMALYDVWENKGELYLVLEYIEGGELFDYLLRKGRLEEKEAIHYFRQIINGVDYCHQFNICHRDLKPENLLLDKNRNIKIADFGMAALEVSDKMLQTSCGSPHYASPEIVSGKNYHGGPSDIWSCGIILFALLTGHLPFDDENIRKLLMKVQAGVFQMPKNISEEAKDLISKMLCVDPETRITMPEIIRHPLLQKYQTKRRHLINNKVNLPFNVFRPIKSIDEIDVEILKNLQILWHGAKRETVIEKLMSEEQNSEKTFYCLLMKYRYDNQDHNKDARVSNTPQQDPQAPKRIKKSSSITSRASRQSYLGHNRTHTRNRSLSARRHSRTTSRSSIVTASSSHKRGVSFSSIKSMKSLRQKTRSNSSIKSYYDNLSDSPPPPIPLDVLSDMQEQTIISTYGESVTNADIFPVPLEDYNQPAQYQVQEQIQTEDYNHHYEANPYNKHVDYHKVQYTNGSPEYEQVVSYNEEPKYEEHDIYDDNSNYDRVNYNHAALSNIDPQRLNQTQYPQELKYNHKPQYNGGIQYNQQEDKENSNEFASMLEEAFDFSSGQTNNGYHFTNNRRSRIVSDPFPNYNDTSAIKNTPHNNERRVVSDYLYNFDNQNQHMRTNDVVPPIPPKTHMKNPPTNTTNGSYGNTNTGQNSHNYILPLIFEEDDRFADAIEEVIEVSFSEDPNKTPEMAHDFQFEDVPEDNKNIPEPNVRFSYLSQQNELQLPEIPDTPTYEDPHLKNVHTAARAASIAATATSIDFNSIGKNDSSTTENGTMYNSISSNTENNDSSFYEPYDESDNNSLASNDKLHVSYKDDGFKQRPQSMFANYPGMGLSDQENVAQKQRRSSHDLLKGHQIKSNEEPFQLQPPPHLIKSNFIESPKLNTHTFTLKPINVNPGIRSVSTPVTMGAVNKNFMHSPSDVVIDNLSVTSPFTNDKSDSNSIKGPTNTNVVINNDSGKTTIFRKLSLNPKRAAPPPPLPSSSTNNNTMNGHLNNIKDTPASSQTNSRVASGSSQLSYASGISHPSTVSSTNSYLPKQQKSNTFHPYQPSQRVVSQGNKSINTTIYTPEPRPLPVHNSALANKNTSTTSTASVTIVTSANASAAPQTSHGSNNSARINSSNSGFGDNMKQNWFMKMLNKSSSVQKYDHEEKNTVQPIPRPQAKNTGPRINRFSTLSSSNLLSNYDNNMPYTSYTSTSSSPVVRNVLLNTLRDWKQYGVSDIKIEEFGQSQIKIQPSKSHGIQSTHVPLKIKISAKVSSRNVLSLRSTKFVIELEMQKVRESVPIKPLNPAVVNGSSNNSGGTSNGKALFKRLLGGGRKHISNISNGGNKKPNDDTNSNIPDGGLRVTTKHLTIISVYQMKGSNSTFLRFIKELETVLISKGGVSSTSVNGGYVDIDFEESFK